MNKVGESVLSRLWVRTVFSQQLKLNRTPKRGFHMLASGNQTGKRGWEAPQKPPASRTVFSSVYYQRKIFAKSLCISCKIQKFETYFETNFVFSLELWFFLIKSTNKSIRSEGKVPLGTPTTFLSMRDKNLFSIIVCSSHVERWCSVPWAP